MACRVVTPYKQIRKLNRRGELCSPVKKAIFSVGGTEPSAAGGRRSEAEAWQRSEKIEDQRKPDDFFGHRNRTAGLFIDEVQNLYIIATGNGLSVQPET